MAYVFSVPDMSCGHCKKHIDEALKEWGKAKSWTVDLDAKKVTVDTDESAEFAERVIQDVGYSPKRI